MKTLLLCVALLLGGAVASFGQGGNAGELGRGDSDVAVATNVLTPGQATEWALTVDDGETIVATASTPNFDPALQLVDAAGKTIAENDDIRPGVQDARLLYRFARGGSYKLLVKAFKGAGGGQFRMSLRRFVAADLHLAERVASPGGATPIRYWRFSADAGQTLLIQVQAGQSPAIAVFGPDGGPVGIEPGARLVFRTATRGDHYLRLQSPAACAFTLAAARVFALQPDAPATTRKLGAGGMDIVTFTGAAGELVRISAKAPGAGVAAELDAVGDPTPDPVVRFQANPKAPGELVALLRRAGAYQVSVTQPVGLEVDYTLTATRMVRTWSTASELSQSLAVGEADWLLVDGKAGEILRLEGASAQFDIDLDLFDPTGERVGNNDDGGSGRDALLTVLLSRAGKYLLRVHSYGDGGGGAYRLRRAPDPVRPLKIGERGGGSLGAGGSDIWSFTGKAGQTILLSVRSADFDTFVKVFGPDGIEIAASDDDGDGTNSLLSVRLPLEGTFTIWVSGKSGAGKYTVRLLDAE